MFNVVGQQGNLPTTASGTNAITLTPGANYYVPAAYTNAQIYSFKAVATSSGSVTLAQSGLAFLKLFMASGVQAGSGDIVNATHYSVQYWADLDSGNGAFIVISATSGTVTSIANPVQGTFKNLVITVASNTAITPTADSLILQNAGGGTVRITSYAPSNTSTAASGANGLDTGSVAASTWYFFYAIWNANTSTAAGLISTSATSPTLPSGYTYFARLGAVLTDGSANLYRTIQKGRDAQYVVGTNPVNVINVANATAGTYSAASPTLAAVSIAGVVPTTASEVFVLASNTWKGGTLAQVLVAPSTAWGGTNNGPTGSGGNIFPVLLTNPATTLLNVRAEIVLEASTIAWTTANTGGAISVMGWRDNI